MQNSKSCQKMSTCILTTLWLMSAATIQRAPNPVIWEVKHSVISSPIKTH